MNKKFTCCICGKEFEGWGNNPDGALDHETLKPINFDSEHVCCDDCNRHEVIPGRLIMIQAHRTMNDLDFEMAEEGIEQLRSLVAENKVSQEMYEFILANWDLLVKKGRR